jgi:hypothetical protein
MREPDGAPAIAAYRVSACAQSGPALLTPDCRQIAARQNFDVSLMKKMADSQGPNNAIFQQY